MVSPIPLPTVAVVIPTIGRASLTRSVESALAQSFPATQVIVAIDGPAHEPAARSRLNGIDAASLQVLVAAPAGCPAGPRNAALEHVTCDLVAFLDDDDSWAPSKLELQVGCFAAGVVAVASNATVVNVGEPHLYFDHPPAAVALRDMFRANPIITSSMVCRTDVLRACGGFPLDPPLLDDYLAWVRVASCGTIRILSEPLVSYAGVVGNSVSSRIDRSTSDPVGDVLRATWRWSHATSQPKDVRRTVAIAWFRHLRRRGAVRCKALWNRFRHR